MGIFSSFSWDENLQDFGRYNLIYGWNGSGKTTLSNLFSALATGAIADYPDLKYEIETEASILKNGQALPSSIRVFNQNYVANNVHPVSGKAKPILILGEANKKVADAVAADEAALASKRERVETLDEELKRVRTEKNKLFSDIAKTITLNTSGLAPRNYRKPDAENALASLKEKRLLDDSDVTAHALELKQSEKPDVSEVAEPQLTSDEEERSIKDSLNKLKDKGGALCIQTVESQLIERLKENSDIALWVEQGVELHRRHASQECEFCNQLIPSERTHVLANHFNEADRELKNEIDAVLGILDAAIAVIHMLDVPDKANLYDELQQNYRSAVEQFIGAKIALLAQMESYRQSLSLKKTKTTESVVLEVELDATSLDTAIDKINAEIRRHNQKNADFSTAKDSARTKLEAHYVSTIYDEAKTLETHIVSIEAEIKEINEGHPQRAEDIGIIGLVERIALNRQIISSLHKGCQEINIGLNTFLGRDELQFEVEEEGYVLMRGGKAAEKLSEGEKTAIGFVHFVTYLMDQDFDPATGIIVVDDPISSLDSNSIFQAFAFLKNSVKDAKQVFVMTHNFDFLRLLLNWVKYSKEKARYYMIKNTLDASAARTATIAALDKLLQDHETEYHYLFKLLYVYQSDERIESAYGMPNIARKVLETFLMFRVPSSESMYVKMEKLTPFFDANKITAIYKFTNNQSHMTGKGFDPSLVPETQKNVRYLLELIESVFPEHYRILVSSMSV